MDEAKRHSRIFQDLLDLEKDFKYNLGLLKIKDSEIARCSKTNEELCEINGKLNSEIVRLRLGLRTAEQEKQVALKNLDESRKRMENYRREVERKADEREKSFAEIMSRKQITYRENMDEVRNQAQKEMLLVSKAKEQLKTLMDENMDLRNKIRQVESLYVSETSFYKSELKTIRSTYANLTSKTDQMKRDLSYYRTESEQCKARLQEALSDLENLISVNKEQTQVNQRLNEKFTESRRANEELIMRADELTRERDRLKREIAAGLEKSFCNAPDHHHSRNEEVLRQNVMLREVVKSMRRDREMLVEKELDEMQNAEKRIEKLETIVEFFKPNVIPNLT